MFISLYVPFFMHIFLYMYLLSMPLRLLSVDIIVVDQFGNVLVYNKQSSANNPTALQREWRMG